MYIWALRQRGHHAAQSAEGEGGEGHASENWTADEQQRAAAAAGAQWSPSSRTHQQRGRQGYPSAPGELTFVPVDECSDKKAYLVLIFSV